MLKANRKTLKVNLPWLLIAMVLLCTVISYYMVHYRVYQTFSTKVVKLDNIYSNSLSEANGLLIDVREQLTIVDANGCSNEMVNALRNYILTSKTQEIVWLIFISKQIAKALMSRSRYI